MPKADFSKVIGRKAKKENKKPAKAVKKSSKKPVAKKQVVGVSKPAEKKIKQQIKKFQKKPKKEREKQSEGFDFSQITEQIKQKVQNVPTGAGFNPAAVEEALQKEKQPLIQKIPVIGKVAKKMGGKKIERVPTGIKGLDELIEGGFEKGSSVLIVGSAGTGKTLFGLQFLYNGAIKYNEPGIFISFEEERESLYKHSSAFNWDFEKLEKEKMFKVLEYKPHQVEKLMREGGGSIKDQIKAMGAKRLVIDSITSYGLLFRDEYQKRENILEFFELLKKWGCTSIIISELPPKVAEVKEGSVGFLTDAIISLYYTKEEEKGVRVHSCEILKMRGTKHTNKLLAVGFEKDGLAIYAEVEVF